MYVQSGIMKSDCTSGRTKGKFKGNLRGFPMVTGAWCNRDLKVNILKQFDKPDIIQYIGIAADEPNRFHNLTDRKRSPLVEYDVTEAEARRICEELDLLSPIYTQAERGGCWFCHNQGAQQLRLLRKQYPEYWALMLKWDLDSSVTFKPGHKELVQDEAGNKIIIYVPGKTVHDYDKRFQLEDDGFISADDKVFRWKMLDKELNYRLF